MQAVEVVGVSKCFNEALVFDDLSFSVGEGELMWLSGPSGSGKTTLLRVIAGLEIPDKGTVLIKGIPASGPGGYLAPGERQLGMVFQDFALWPHMTVERHLDFVLKGKKAPRRIRQTRIAELLALCRLEDRSRTRPAQLSGGQQQRLAIARALAVDPSILLMDEPFSNLDSQLKEQVLTEIISRKRDRGLTAIIATHDRNDIESQADHVVILGA